MVKISNSKAYRGLPTTYEEVINNEKKSLYKPQLTPLNATHEKTVVRKNGKVILEDVEEEMQFKLGPSSSKRDFKQDMVHAIQKEEQVTLQAAETIFDKSYKLSQYSQNKELNLLIKYISEFVDVIKTIEKSVAS